MNFSRIRSFLLLLVLMALTLAIVGLLESTNRDAPLVTESISYPEFVERFLAPTMPVAQYFDFPLRTYEGVAPVVLQDFGETELESGLRHLGQDWKLAPRSGDLGTPVQAIADGWVSAAVDVGASWGKVVQIIHRLPGKEDPPALIESMYAHLGTIEVEPFQFVHRGQRIGTLGNAEGAVPTHLGFELRRLIDVGLGFEYSAFTGLWLNPNAFISDNRPSDAPPVLPTVIPESERDKWLEKVD